MGCTGSSTYELPEDAYQKAEAPTPVTVSGCFTDEYFTQEQKILVKESWKLLDNAKVDKGVKIFLRIFEKEPNAKQLFPFRNLEGQELLSNPVFRGHATRFIHAVGNTINNLDVLEISCVPTLLQLGRKHVVVVEFLDAYMEVFIEAIQHVFEQELGQECNKEVHEAWTAVFQFICSKMLEGYNAEKGESKFLNGHAYVDKQMESGIKSQNIKDDIVPTGENIISSVEDNSAHMESVKKEDITVTIESEDINDSEPVLPSNEKLNNDRENIKLNNVNTDPYSENTIPTGDNSLPDSDIVCSDINDIRVITLQTNHNTAISTDITMDNENNQRDHSNGELQQDKPHVNGVTSTGRTTKL